MKKHRNFLIFYGLWLAAIAGIFVAFGEERPDGPLQSDGEICTLTKDHLQHSTKKACDKKTCGLNSTRDKANCKEGLGKI